MAAWSKRALAIVCACAPLLGTGCARDATGVLVAVDADATAPPILILRTTVARAADPGQSSSSNRSSPNLGDAGDRPGPFAFPFELSVTTDESYAGPVAITVEGLDWDTGVVTARGSADAVVVVRNTTHAAVTLIAAPVTALDGGLD